MMVLRMYFKRWPRFFTSFPFSLCILHWVLTFKPRLKVHGLGLVCTLLTDVCSASFVVYRSISLTDMRDEEEDVDSLSPHSQTRHERLHNQYNKLKEEEDQWQDVSHI